LIWAHNSGPSQGHKSGDGFLLSEFQGSTGHLMVHACEHVYGVCVHVCMCVFTCVCACSVLPASSVLLNLSNSNHFPEAPPLDPRVGLNLHHGHTSKYLQHVFQTNPSHTRICPFSLTYFIFLINPSLYSKSILFMD
jgi:hypothetical protein